MQDVYKGVSLRSAPVEDRGPKQEWAEEEVGLRWRLKDSLGQPARTSTAGTLSIGVLIWAEMARSSHPGFDPSLDRRRSG